VDEATPHQKVSLTYADTHRQRYISVSGIADLIRDVDKFKELWKPAYEAWFPAGVDDPQLVLLMVTVTKAEYWSAPGGALAGIVVAATSALSGSQDSGGEHESLVFSGAK
jgi:general stress protein 26